MLQMLLVMVCLSRVVGAVEDGAEPVDTKMAAATKTIEFSAGRVEAWDLHIHPLIETLFTEAGLQYSLYLRDMCNSTFHEIEQGMKSLFENDLMGNQARVRDMLAPSLLQAEKEEGTLDARRRQQSDILRKMLDAHPMSRRQ